MQSESENRYAPPRSASGPDGVLLAGNPDPVKAAAFVGAKYAYFREKWQKETGWNWAGFFLGVIWLFYRKMYLYGFLALGVLIVESVLAELFFTLVAGLPETPRAYEQASRMVYSLVFALWGNLLYRRHVRNQIASIAPFEAGPAELDSLRRAGGVNLAGAILLSVVLIALVALAVHAKIAGI